MSTKPASTKSATRPNHQAEKRSRQQHTKHDSIESSSSRRNFLKHAGTLTAAALTAPAVTPLLSTPSAAQSAAQSTAATETAESATLAATVRRDRAFQLRVACAQYQQNQPLPQHAINGDEQLYASKFASFSKALPHNKLGEVDLNVWQSLVNALTTGNTADFESLAFRGSTKLVDPQAAFAFSMEGADSQQFSLPAPPAFSSEEQAGEMVELYWRALTRDIPFSQYGNEPLTSAAVNDLKRFSRYSGINASQLFRGGLPGEEKGPRISQFLWKPFTLGLTPVEQLYRTPISGNDHLTSYPYWLAVQNGADPPTRVTFDKTPRYIRNGRDLSSYVHQDFSYQAFLNATLLLLSYGSMAFAAANPYKASRRQAGFATFGSPHILSLVAQVANAALKAAWFQKWLVHRRIRPEEYSGRVHNHVNNAATYPLDAKLLDSPALSAVFSKHGTYILPLAYPEGCPVHPSYPSGHAAIAGACATVLKAFFEESFIISNPVVASDDGLTLQPYNSGNLTVGMELNKLAANIAYGRDTAGMHWRSDEAAGLQLGEEVALAILVDQNSTFHQPFNGFRLTKFDGTTVTVKASGA